MAESLESAVLVAIGVALVGRYVIAPGRSIGLVRIGETESEVASELGEPPNGGDTAMGRKWVGWDSTSARRAVRGHELDVCLVRRNDVYTVDEIRTTSASFHTTSGARVGSSFAEINRLFPRLTKVDVASAELVDDVSAGIAFEFRPRADSHSPCRAVLVHRRGRGVQDEYLPFYRRR